MSDGLGLGVPAPPAGELPGSLEAGRAPWQQQQAEGAPLPQPGGSRSLDATAAGNAVSNLGQAIGPLVGGPEPRKQTCTFAGAPPTRCRRPNCRRPFIPRPAGRRQAFCSKDCRIAFHVEVRQVGYRKLRPVPAQARRARPASIRRSGIDVATGRRVAISTMTTTSQAGGADERRSR